MALRFSPIPQVRRLLPTETFGAVREDLGHRWSLAREPNPEDAHGPSLRRLAAEIGRCIYDPVFRATTTMTVDLAANPRTVMLLPGLFTHPKRMGFMARQLEQAGHMAKRWGLGYNFGPTEENFERLQERLATLRARQTEPVVLIGWSLGGLFARELAKRHPEAVSKVITMGTPFSGSKRANNAWRLYQFATGHRVDSPPVPGRFEEKPPVETIAFWSPRDGVIAPRSAAGRPGERDRAIAVRCTHVGFASCPDTIRAVLRELDRG